LERKSLPRLQQDAKAQRIKQLQRVIEHEAAIVARGSSPSVPGSVMSQC
jgi:hypothetical protein